MRALMPDRTGRRVARGAGLLFWLGVAALVLEAVPPPQVQPPVVDLTADGVAAAASKYVTEYQKAFAFLVAEETTHQQVVEDDVPTHRRRLEGELFMAYLPADGEWITVHDVAKVDGRPVADQEDLQRLLQSGDAAGAVARVANRNAQFNIGTIVRNFNEPTLPLLILENKRLANSRFRRIRIQGDGDLTLVTIGFEERDRTTLIRSATGGAVQSKGSFVIEAGSGLVRETTLELEDGPVKARLVTTYAPDEKLDLWVPVSFQEHYERRHRSGKREVVTGESTYVNYRRFQATGRIKR